jgi:glycosyltransferase involved in cell wall biosynthesis
MQSLSVLIPAYNCNCLPLVEQLLPLLQSDVDAYEVIVSDDATADPEIIKANEAINQLPGCRYILKTENAGSAANRNYLGAISQYPLLLFLDCDIVIPDKGFLKHYLSTPIDGVVNGGISIIQDARLYQNLRYRYEKAQAPAHTAVMRQAHRYQHFRSTNFMITRSAFEKCTFDERFTRSGYEDVLYGKMLKQQHINVVHIDNPVLMTKFESNSDYVNKIERSLQTLYTFRQDLRGYSRLLTFVSGIHLPIVRNLIRLWHKIFKKAERRNLCGSRPSLFIFKLYRLGYYLSLQ